MFFSEKITSIKDEDLVLEVGPGGTPHPRSNVFLEKQFENENEREFQRGFASELETEKKVVFYDGGKFPFSDGEFDYAICSHVLEHVEDVDFFISELKRVSRRGYLEYPLVYYDYMYNFDVHISFVKLKGNTINWMPKKMTDLGSFASVHQFFFETLKQEYFSLIDQLKTYFFEGFEWDQSLKSQKVNRLSEVCFESIEGNIPKFSAAAKNETVPDLDTKQKVKNKLKALIDRF